MYCISSTLQNLTALSKRYFHVEDNDLMRVQLFVIMICARDLMFLGNLVFNWICYHNLKLYYQYYWTIQIY